MTSRSNCGLRSASTSGMHQSSSCLTAIFCFQYAIDTLDLLRRLLCVSGLASGMLVSVSSIICSLAPKLRPMLPSPRDYPIGADTFFDDMREYFVGVGILSPIGRNSKKYRIESDGRTLQKVLNRVAGRPVHAQTAVFNYFTGIINELIRRGKAEGKSGC